LFVGVFVVVGVVWCMALWSWCIVVLRMSIVVCLLLNVKVLFCSFVCVVVCDSLSLSHIVCALLKRKFYTHKNNNNNNNNNINSKPRGLRAARTLKKHRQVNRWADKQ
jgi:hypothetical protein